MLKRTISVALIALLLGASGCCGPIGQCIPRKFCGSGCGELYISDWHNYPPECQDPCDCHGDYTGGKGSKYSGPPSGIPVETVTYEVVSSDETVLDWPTKANR